MHLQLACVTPEHEPSTLPSRLAAQREKQITNGTTRHSVSLDRFRRYIRISKGKERKRGEFVILELFPLGDLRAVSDPPDYTVLVLACVVHFEHPLLADLTD